MKFLFAKFLFLFFFSFYTRFHSFIFIRNLIVKFENLKIAVTCLVFERVKYVRKSVVND